MAVSEEFRVETDSNLDHWFSGIMFDVESNYDDSIPIERLQIAGIAVKGSLGDISIYTSAGSHRNKYDNEQQWNKVYEQTHQSNGQNYELFHLEQPINLPQPGQSQAIYIHTTSLDRMIRYGDERASITYENSFLKIYPGLGHTSEIPFDVDIDWWTWRPHREFVGQLKIIAKYRIWCPLRNKYEFQGRQFINSVYTFLLCMQRVRTQGRVLVNKDVISNILDWLHWSDFHVTDVNYNRNVIGNRTNDKAINWQRGHYGTLVRFHRAEYIRRVQDDTDL